ncbi:hypothetical protein BGX29_004237, partial [Mortierella sp. GBA35]
LENNIGTKTDGVTSKIEIRSWDGSSQPTFAKNKVESHRNDEKLDDRLEVGSELEANVIISIGTGATVDQYIELMVLDMTGNIYHMLILGFFRARMKGGIQFHGLREGFRLITVFEDGARPLDGETVSVMVLYIVQAFGNLHNDTQVFSQHWVSGKVDLNTRLESHNEGL